jgi:hypothetical protein
MWFYNAGFVGWRIEKNKTVVAAPLFIYRVDISFCQNFKVQIESSIRVV